MNGTKSASELFSRLVCCRGTHLEAHDALGLQSGFWVSRAKLSANVDRGVVSLGWRSVGLSRRNGPLVMCALPFESRERFRCPALGWVGWFTSSPRNALSPFFGGGFPY